MSGKRRPSEPDSPTRQVLKTPKLEKDLLGDDRPAPIDSDETVELRQSKIKVPEEVEESTPVAKEAQVVSVHSNIPYNYIILHTTKTRKTYWTVEKTTGNMNTFEPLRVKLSKEMFQVLKKCAVNEQKIDEFENNVEQGQVVMIEDPRFVVNNPTKDGTPLLYRVKAVQLVDCAKRIVRIHWFDEPRFDYGKNELEQENEETGVVNDEHFKDPVVEHGA